MTPEKISGEFSPEQLNPQEKLKSAVKESLLYALQDKNKEEDFFERFFSHFNESNPEGIGEEYKSKYNDLLNLRHSVEFVKEDLESGDCKTEEEAIEKFFSDKTVKETLGL